MQFSSCAIISRSANPLNSNFADLLFLAQQKKQTVRGSAAFSLFIWAQ